MIEVSIRITAPNEETLRRAMDEVLQRGMEVDAEAGQHEKMANCSQHERVAKKYELLGRRGRDVAKVLDAIADAIDHAQPRKVL